MCHSCVPAVFGDWQSLTLATCIMARERETLPRVYGGTKLSPRLAPVRLTAKYNVVSNTQVELRSPRRGKALSLGREGGLATMSATDKIIRRAVSSIHSTIEVGPCRLTTG